ncbi:MAG: hypothetical protein A2Z72_06150 [Omnitrophica bacterium RBG_13_46_9]|nr:MAG: hypothetical protein A2Z72_06150 [Omnitrophica bacterium RBG_13_46_9]
MAKIKDFTECIRKNINLSGITDRFIYNKRRILPYIKEIKRMERLTIVRLRGSIDANSLPSVNGDLRRCLDRNIFLDFKEVTHVDSSTLATLVFLLNELRKQQNKLGIINANALVDNYLEIKKIKPLIQIYKSEEEALADLM